MQMSIKQDQYTLIDDTGREAAAIKTKAGMGMNVMCKNTSSNKLKLKGYKQARQDLQPSLTRRQVTRLHFKTIAECLKPLYLYSR
jgi:hypothetical protein